MAWYSIAAIWACLILAAPASAGIREETLSLLESIAASWKSAELEVWLNGERGSASDREPSTVTLGASQQFSFLTQQDAHLLAVYIDAHGVATVFFPTTSAEDCHALAGRELRFPGGDGTLLGVTPPLGREDLFVFATPSPTTLSDLGFPSGADGYPIVDEADALGLAAKIGDRLASFPASQVAVARLKLRVVGRSETASGLTGSKASSGTISPDYTVEDIVGYFTSRRTRSIRRPRFDLQIHFETGSTALSEKATANLDVIIAALNHPVLNDKNFEVGGHTDDVEADVYNPDLSKRRSESVQRYLIEAGRFDPSRLTAKAYGETNPLEHGTSGTARAMNRRVELTLVRGN
jgi:outer membrane protein OmpA-like peptidoglycan-associated protein